MVPVNVVYVMVGLTLLVDYVNAKWSKNFHWYDLFHEQNKKKWISVVNFFFEDFPTITV